MGKTQNKKSKLNYRGIIAILVIIAVIVAIVIFATRKDKENEQPPVETYKTEEDGAKFNTSEKLQETKTFDGYEISAIDLNEIDGKTNFTAKIKNVTDKTIGNKSAYIVFKTQSGEEIYRMQVYLSEIQPGKTINVNSKLTVNVVESYDIELQF